MDRVCSQHVLHFGRIYHALPPGAEFPTGGPAWSHWYLWRSMARDWFNYDQTLLLPDTARMDREGEGGPQEVPETVLDLGAGGRS